MLGSATLKERIRDEAAKLGFVHCGFALADAVPGAGEQLKAWIAEGRHGTMGWMEERIRHRAHPQALWPDAKSVIALAMSYAPAADPRSLAEEARIGRISAYAQGGDYHKTVKKALKALARFIVDQVPSELKVFVDTAPVMEKPLSAAAGIGWQGKHTNLLSREGGNWLFLGVIFTSLKFEPSHFSWLSRLCASASAPSRPSNFSRSALLALRKVCVAIDCRIARVFFTR